MGIYDSKVAAVLGEDVVQEIKRYVNEGVIDKVKMQDMARDLHPTVGGNQMRRERWDASAMSEILSDWYNQDLCEDEDRPRALKKLIDICLKLNLGPLRRFLKDKLSTLQPSGDTTPAPDPPMTGSNSLAANILLKTLLILGKTGSGKSTLCNRLAGENHDSNSFPVDSDASSCTQENVLKNVNFGGDKERKVTLIDTVGFDDPDKDQQEVIDDLRKKISETSSFINIFGITINSHSRRLESSHVKMLETFQDIFGTAFWKNCILIFTQKSMDQGQIENRKRIAHKSDDEAATDFVHQVNKRFPESNNLRYLFLDACFNQGNPSEWAYFEKAMEILYKNIKNAADFKLPTREQKHRSNCNELILETEIKTEVPNMIGSRIQEVFSTHERILEMKDTKNQIKETKMKRQASDSNEKDYIKRQKKISLFHEKILDHPYPQRLSLCAWASEVEKGRISKPTPLTYHRRFQMNPSFLRDSFKGEALPGVFRPSGSELNENEAIEMFEKENPSPLPSLIVLNKWIFKKYRPLLPKFDKKIHSIEKKPFDLTFYAQMRPLEFSQIEDQDADSDRKPHRVWDQEGADRYVRSNPKLLHPLQEYIADASLTTIGPSKDNWNDYKGYCVPHPTKGGHLIAKVMFDHNAFSYNCITRNTEAGICAICGGLLVLPHHVVALCYWWPEGLKDSQVIISVILSPRI